MHSYVLHVLRSRAASGDHSGQVCTCQQLVPLGPAAVLQVIAACSYSWPITIYPSGGSDHVFPPPLCETWSDQSMLCLDRNTQSMGTARTNCQPTTISSLRCIRKETKISRFMSEARGAVGKMSFVFPKFPRGCRETKKVRKT